MSYKFIDKSHSLDTYWRSIILLGKNTASYKFALAKTLLNLDIHNNQISLEEIALPYAKNICDHLISNDKQASSSSSKFLDFCRSYNKNEINQDELKKHTIELGFKNVIDAFHNISQSEIPRFFEDARKSNKSIILTDNFHELINLDTFKNLQSEAESRWNLWETAISLGMNSNIVEVHNDIDSEKLFILKDNTRRIDVTSSKDALNGYQKGKCFYCSRLISIKPGTDYSCDVDHFFPHMLKQHGFKSINQVWNLVLSCKDCNRGSGGKFERIPDISYLDKLHERNDFYIESHHPLRETIINQTGRLEIERISFLQDFYDRTTTINPSLNKWKPKEIILGQ